MTILDILTLTSFVIAAFILIYATIKRDEISRFVSVKNLGIFERDLPGLVQVVVLANKVEKPNNTLAEAVEDNFREGVKYLFLVSNCNAEQELRGYYLIFEALAKIVTENDKSPIDAKNLVNIKRLPYDWPDVPYIFYQYQTDEESERYTIAFRGNQKGEGISNFYEKLSRSHSKAIVLALLAEAPAEIKEKFKLVDNVKEFKPVNRKQS